MSGSQISIWAKEGEVGRGDWREEEKGNEKEDMWAVVEVDYHGY